MIPSIFCSSTPPIHPSSFEGYQDKTTEIIKGGATTRITRKMHSTYCCSYFEKLNHKKAIQFISQGSSVDVKTVYFMLAYKITAIQQYDYACFKKILKLVEEPDQVTLTQEGGCSATFSSKIQCMVKELTAYYRKSASEEMPPLSHLDSDELGRVNIISELVKKVIDSNCPGLVKERAQWAMLLLEKLDSGLHTVNWAISNFLDPKSKKIQKSAKKILHRFTENPPEAIYFERKVKPHSPSKNEWPVHFQCRTLPPPQDNLDRHNAFWKLEKIYVDSSKESRCCIENLKEIAAIEKIPVIHEVEHVHTWLRDPLIILKNKQILIPSPLPLPRQNPSKFSFFGGTSDSLLPKTILSLCSEEKDSSIPCIMGQIANDDMSTELLRSGLKGLKEAPFYFEGGNLIPAVNKYGEIIYLSGAHNVLFSLLNSYNIFSTEEKMGALIDEMRSLENTSFFEKTDLLSIYQRFQAADLILSNHSFEDRVLLAKIILASSKVIEKQMEHYLEHTVQTLGNLFELPPEFHLDLFLMPAPNGAIFIQDHALTAIVLKNLLKNAPLNAEEFERIFLYLQAAEQKQETDGKKLELIRDELERLGFFVISTAGSFYLNSNSLPSVNFLNAIVGMGEKESFCITNGSCHFADRYLREFWTKTLQAHGINHVYYTGKKTSGFSWTPPKFYAEADDGLKVGGGIHCRVQEINHLQQGFELEENEPCNFKEEDVPPKDYSEELPKFFNKMLDLFKK